MVKRSRLKKGITVKEAARIGSPFVGKDADGKFKIYMASPFGYGLVKRVKGTRAFKTRLGAEKRMRKLV